MNLFEEIIDVQIEAGETMATVVQTTDDDNSDIIGIVQYNNNIDNNVNSGLIMLQVYNNQDEVSRLQHIDNYRSREAAYDKGYKPCVPFQSGKKVTVKIVATQPFDADFLCQIILIKQPKENC